LHGGGAVRAQKVRIGPTMLANGDDACDAGLASMAFY
jgi:hypothetical protein